MSLPIKTLFALRRAWLIGVCTRHDLERAFDDLRSPAVTSKVMKDIAASCSGELYWHKRSGLRPKTNVITPSECDASKVLDLLASGSSPQETGIFPDDGLPLLMPPPIRSVAQTPRANEAILQAWMHKLPIRILYVGLKRNDRAKWRTLMPCALEFTGVTWRLHAQDMDAPEKGYPIKTFVIYRVMNAEVLNSYKAPKNFRPLAMVRTQATLRVSLHDDLTPEQAQSVRWGLGIDEKGQMKWAHHSLYEFKRDWAGSPPATDIVWPVLSRVDTIED